MLAQRTLKSLTKAVGVGLHGGQRVELTLRPAAPDTGIVFRRVDLPEPVDIPVTAESVTDAMSHQCPYCQGRGRVWSPETMAIQIEREIRRLAAKQELDAVLVYCNPEVAAWMIGSEGDDVEQLERLIRKPVRPKWRPVISLVLGNQQHEVWKDFLDVAYWNVELEE